MSEQQPKFSPGEIAVLVTDNGARLFEVEDTTFHGQMQRVHEHYIQPGDTKSRYQLYGGLGTPYSSLIKIADESLRNQAVKLLNDRAEEARRLVSAAEMEARRLRNQAEQSIRELVGDNGELS